MLTRVFSRIAPHANRVAIPADLSSVVTVDAASEVDPGEVGMTRHGVESIWNGVLNHYRTGFQPSIALCLRHKGKIILNRTVGHQRGNSPQDPPGAQRVVTTPGTPYCVFSASKAVTAMLVHLLDERGVLHIDDRVVEYIPEFGRHGKETITLRHVLTHRAGLPFAEGADDSLAMLSDWDAVVEMLCDARPRTTHGRRVSYHAITGGFVLGEVIRRVTGKPINDVLREEIGVPLGMQRFHYGCSPEEAPLVAQAGMTGEPPPFPFSNIFKRALGLDFPRIPEVANDPRFLCNVVPSGNLICTAEEMSRFYQLLLDLGRFGDRQIFEPRTIRRARNESAYLEFDQTLLLPVRYGLGFMLGGDQISLYGTGTPEAFGHLGFTNTITWADPAREVAAALLTTGKSFVPLDFWVQREILSAITAHCQIVA